MVGWTISRKEAYSMLLVACVSCAIIGLSYYLPSENSVSGEQQGSRSILLSKSPRLKSLRVRHSATKGGIIRAAHRAHQTLSSIADSLDASGPSLQKTELASEVQKALQAIARLEGMDAGDNGMSEHQRAYAHVVSEVQTMVSRQKSKSKAKDTSLSDLKALNGIAFKDDSQVRDELKKLVATARRLEAEMSSLSEDKQSTVLDAERVRQAAKLVEMQGHKVQSAESVETSERKEVVRHELAVAKEKLAAAEASELAAERATREARAAERLAVQKHRLAAQEEHIALVKRLAAKRAREIAAEGLEKPSPSVDLYHRLSAKIDRECRGVIDVLGCADLPQGSACHQFCNGNQPKQLASTGESITNNNEGSGDNPDADSPISSSNLPNELIHHRVGYFANGGGKDSYVDSVYGDPYDSNTYVHQRTGFFTTMPEGVRAGQAGSDTIYGELGGAGDGDVASNGRDVGQVTGRGPAAVLEGERRLAGKLRGALAQAEAENRMLQERVAEQNQALDAVAKTQLPRY